MKRFVWLLLLLPQIGAQAIGLHAPTGVIFDLDRCVDAVVGQGDTALAEGLAITEPLRLLSWNVHKGLDDAWLRDFQRLSESSDLVLLQEAVLEHFDAHGRDTDRHWSLAPGYQTSRFLSGVFTSSPVKPLLTCHLQHREPWLRSPKATSIKFYPIHGSEQALMVVNTHLINFTFGTKAFRRQLGDIERALEVHAGPVILAGDFNTWRMQRVNALSALRERQKLREIDFVEDHRSQIFGFPLDYILVRDMVMIDSATKAIDSSDHAPLTATLRFNTVHL